MSDQTSSLLNEFSEFLGVPAHDAAWDQPFAAACADAERHIQESGLLPADQRHKAFLRRANSKFRFNAGHLRAFYGSAARLKTTFNYHQKQAIQALFDGSDLDALPQLLVSFGVERSTIDALTRVADCVDPQETLNLLRDEIQAPSRLRVEVGARRIDIEILKSLYAAFLWVALPASEMHRLYDSGFNQNSYHDSYWDELKIRLPDLFLRDHALHLVVLDQQWADEFDSYEHLTNAVLATVRSSYQELDNYGFLAIAVRQMNLAGREISWELAADIVLFGEKHLERPLERAYFRPERIQAETLAANPSVDVDSARFNLANEGFTYRDCFVLKTSRSDGGIAQLLILQKNDRDETVIPCPACRSGDVEGNSYPSLGVRSWECRNPLCPDRSKYNRGKRYSFRGLLMQKAIDDERNEIPPGSVNGWRRDVVGVGSDAEVLEMLVRHYSMCGDRIQCWGRLDEVPSQLLGRELNWLPMPIREDRDELSWFRDAAIFKRYAEEDTTYVRGRVSWLGDPMMRVACGDARDALAEMDEMTVDGAVTSPPYYNAREYSQWPNIYGYLHEMMEVGRGVYRVLKPGALYFYNIFDYFDNERTLAFSAMGQKRMILSAYTVDMFRRIGFQCVGNVVWDKGSIEGKRGFNAGNNAPFYQSPFNCWEHILVFRRPDSSASPTSISRVLEAKPVIKMVKGENRHGHSAPFPPDIPLLCIESVPLDGLVLDPFAGSMTTGRAAVAHGRRAVCIERNTEYCELGLRLYAAEASDEH